MAQSEDTELRDLVIEALEKNGSLAKIRALLRANVFLVFDDEGQNLKQNVSLDNILKIPEGAICLSIIHEFLEFCNLKNTLFVYMAESRQGSEYIYEGPKKLADKLNFPKKDSSKEPLLVTLLKQVTKSKHRSNYSQNDPNNLKIQDKQDEHNFNDQNCTYIVHEDSNSSGTSTSPSDNSSSDEKNKLHLRLPLDTSDTDTSSDSAKEKCSSEYIPNQHIITSANSVNFKESNYSQNHNPGVVHVKQSNIYDDANNEDKYLQEFKVINNSRSDSTSYVDVKPYNPLDKKLLNTTGIPFMEKDEKESSALPEIPSKSVSNKEEVLPNLMTSKLDSISHTFCNTSTRNEEISDKQLQNKTSIEESVNSESVTPEYSNDFLSSPDINVGVTGNLPVNEESTEKIYKSSVESPRQASYSSQSSVSISDVTDLISEKSSSFGNQNNDNASEVNKQSSKHTDHVRSPQSNSRNEFSNETKKVSDDFGEFSDSPIPSLSNLSLDIHSD